ncbi:MAG: hypothetical protein M0033_02025 [Nitrospiraceae bacterium]|nr:hypothetical protein [Nitrospiraceae bacterium]
MKDKAEPSMPVFVMPIGKNPDDVPASSSWKFSAEILRDEMSPSIWITSPLISEAVLDRFSRGVFNSRTDATISLPVLSNECQILIKSSRIAAMEAAIPTTPPQLVSYAPPPSCSSAFAVGPAIPSAIEEYAP